MASALSLPTGTVTLLFTDIEGSTALMERSLGAAAAALGPEATSQARADGRRRGFDWAIRDGLSPA